MKAKSRLNKRVSITQTIVFLVSLVSIGLWIGVFYSLNLLKGINDSIVIQKTVFKGIELEEGINIWHGQASYYSREGCIGCSANLYMANGKPLDDNKLTVAFNKIPLGKMVRIINNKTHDVVIAEVTDTGGFERHGRIIDLSLATKNAIGCNDLCEVTILTN